MGIPSTNERGARSYYHPAGLVGRLQALLGGQVGDEAPTPNSLASFDQFHTGGLRATIAIGDLLGVAPGSLIVDIGAGLGGPARYFASRGLRVIGIDSSEPFVEAARFLTKSADLEGAVDIRVGDARNIDLPDKSADGAVMLHVSMNIEDREALYAAIWRILRPGAPFVTYDVVSVSGAPDYPVPWASDPSTSFLFTEQATRTALERAGFEITHWEVENVGVAASLEIPAGSAGPSLGSALGVPDFPERVRHLREGLRDGRLAVLTARAHRPSAQPSERI
jgi:sarcosine/dimethylglycine N-methyltransferase